MNDHSIHVVKPESWPDVVDLRSKSEEDRELHFRLHNTSFHLHSHQQQKQNPTLERQSMDFTLKLNNGLLLVQSVAYKRIRTPSTEHYCTMNNLVPGKWKYDPNFMIRTEDKWERCPTLYTQLNEQYWERSLNAWANLRQRREEPLVDYKNRLEHISKIYETAGHTAPTDAEKAVKFILGLDNDRYGDIKARYKQADALKLGKYPDKLIDAYNSVADYASDGKKPSSKPRNQQVAFAAGVEKSSNPSNPSRKGERKGAEKRRLWCHVCKCTDHGTDFCPLVINARSARDHAERTLGSNDKVVARTTVAPSQPPPHQVTTFVTVSTEVKPQDPVVVHTTEFSLNEVVKLSPRALLLDNAATASVVNRADMLYDLTQADYSVSITGLSGESMLTDVRGKIIGLDVQAWLCKEARGNIVVFGHLDEAYDVEHLKRKGFLIRRRGKQDVFFEKRRCDKLGNALYVYNVPEHRLMAVTSVEENKLGYSKRELTDAVRARELSARVAYPSNKDLAELLTTGGIINCPVTAHDVARAEKIFGPDIAGGCYFYILGSGAIVKRDKFTLLPIPNEVIDVLNSLPTVQSRTDITVRYDDGRIVDVDDDDPEEDSLEHLLPEVHQPIVHDETGLELSMEASELPSQVEVMDTVQEHPDTGVLEELPSVESPAASHQYALRREVRAPNKLQYSVKGYADDVPDRRSKHLYHVSVKQMLTKHREATIEAVMKELQQMVDKDVFHPVKRQDLSPEQSKKRIRSFMFMKEKYKPDGTFDKLKARLVGGGHMEDIPSMDISSPTASLEAVLLVAAIAAKEQRLVATADVPGAYLHALMRDTIVMIVEPLLAQILIKIKPTWAEYLDHKGNLNVILKRALYGCLESARLWYDTMSEFLSTNGFQRFEGLKPDRGSKHSYLGMTFDFTLPGEVKVTMEGYTESVLSFYEVEGSVTTPALANLFEIEESKPLDDEKRTKFHSIVAKLLFLAKRTRPDILTAVAFLSTRVTAPSENDWKRLVRVLKYLRGTSELGIVLKPGVGDLRILAYADASYGVHADGKSHSGLCIALGQGPIFVKSSKQKIVSKSSTEAELIGCSQVIWSRDFLVAQGYSTEQALVYQDNTSTMALVKKGKSSSDRTRHIHIRYFFIKDRIEAGEIQVEYIPTERMIADALTKPLTGKRFAEMRQKLLNWYY
eukprot:gene11415-12445_t